jgi:hypothetical protein
MNRIDPMGKVYKGYIEGVDKDVFTAKLNEMGITNEDLIAALIRTVNVVAEEAYWDGRDTGTELAEKD